jgi:hypothetical protein
MSFGEGVIEATKQVVGGAGKAVESLGSGIKSATGGKESQGVQPKSDEGLHVFNMHKKLAENLGVGNIFGVNHTEADRTSIPTGDSTQKEPSPEQRHHLEQMMKSQQPTSK